MICFPDRDIFFKILFIVILQTGRLCDALFIFLKVAILFYTVRPFVSLSPLPRIRKYLRFSLCFLYIQHDERSDDDYNGEQYLLVVPMFTFFNQEIISKFVYIK